ncbi:MAG: MBOAT family protein [Clostridia bacterium]|nr:MBOAT family protein [Clostridia bacterium]
MEFNQLIFPFLFLPASFLLYRIVPGRAKNICLLLLSLLFIVWGSVQDLLLIVISIVFNYFTGLRIGAQKSEDKPKGAALTLVTGIIVNVLFLGYFKYFDFITGNINALFGAHLQKAALTAPVGVSFFTFSVLSYLIDIYRDDAKAEKNVLTFALFVTFFPKLGSGPIIRYKDMAPQMHRRRLTGEMTEEGVRLFLIGLFKKVLLANQLGSLFYPILSTENRTALAAWLGAVGYSFLLYDDFSGYSDMAKGLGNVFGFRLPQNFDYPYDSVSITDFWRRWHASLGMWFREYVYIPLGGSRCSKAKNIRNLLAVWLLTGIWHGANWTFMVWGLYHGVLLILEKFVFAKLLDKLPVILRKILSFLLVMVGWVFFFSPDIGAAFRYLGSMVGVGGGLFDPDALYAFTSFAVLLALCAFFALPVAENALKKLEAKEPIWLKPAEIVLFAVLFCFAIAAMTGDTYVTFLYAQF